MSNFATSQLKDFENSLQKAVQGEIKTDNVTRVLYSTDASIYQIEPLGVFFPKDLDEIAACVQLAGDYGLPVLPRGSGSSLAGQAVGVAIVIDCSRHLDKVGELNAEEKFALIEPGVILASLNQKAQIYGLQFGPDPASEERATMAGVIANNAAGAHSIRYGMCADHVESVEVVLCDGSIALFDEIGIDEARRRSRLPSREGQLYSTALSIREKYRETIYQDWPNTWRRASGYNLNYLIPWSPTEPPQWEKFNQIKGTIRNPYPPINEEKINLATLIAGSEGTLGIIRRARVRLVSRPVYTSLALLSFSNIQQACDAVIEILGLNPSAIELIPSNMIRLAKDVPAYAHQLAFLDDLFDGQEQLPNLIAVEFTGESHDQLKGLSQHLISRFNVPYLIAENPLLQKQIWNVRKVGLGLLMSVPGDTKPIPFIEDLSVPVENLAEFVMELERILAAHNTRGDFYAHASAGCLHLRPLINLKSLDGVHQLREIASQSVKLISQMGGVPSGEHGDGLARSEWLEEVFGQKVGQAFRELKSSADPHGILNPGKIVDPEPMDQHLRYGPGMGIQAWHPVMDFSRQSSLSGAIELCNGAGVCRKSEGIMCPSFQVTRDEMHSTRGRANLLHAMLSGIPKDGEQISERDVFTALDLCIACKGCKAECPSAVDLAKLKYEFLEQYYSKNFGHLHPVRDYLFAYLGDLSRLGDKFNPFTNLVLKYLNKTWFGESWLGLARQRNLPRLAQKRFHSLAKNNAGTARKRDTRIYPVLLLSDPFTEYYQPEIGIHAMELLSAANCQVEIIPIIGSGRTLLSKGFVKAAQNHAQKVVDVINQLDPAQIAPIIGIEPSEIYTLRDEYLDLLPGRKDVESIAERAQMLEEFLIRPGADNHPRLLRIATNNYASEPQTQEILYHGHCYQKTQVPAKDGFPNGVQASIEMLEQVGYKVELIDSGCCGMAGAFGYEAEHYPTSMQIGELKLFPAMRSVKSQQICAASGFSCLSQIRDGTGIIPQHPISLVHKRIWPRDEII